MLLGVKQIKILYCTKYLHTELKKQIFCSYLFLDIFRFYFKQMIYKHLYRQQPAVAMPLVTSAYGKNNGIAP